ncbi:TPA: aminoacyl-tRNA hydrolase [Candidatus Dependentiae bacterium]|nr:aminoacyl-tRNA hydrolase [Candidatus Dependentiae bacterium]
MKEPRIRAIIGLGNPGPAYARTRHNFGFLVVDELARLHGGSWRIKGEAEIAEIMIENQPVILIKPQTFMNASGRVLPLLTKQGIKSEEILVVHDELELPFGRFAIKQGGSARGHNGLKSIIGTIGDQFHRLRCGIGRPENREDVPDYVLASFAESWDVVQKSIAAAADMIGSFVSTNK